MIAMRLGAFIVLIALCGQAFAQGAKESAPVDLPPSQLKPGEFIWSPQAVPAGPLVMVISLDEQRAYVYRNGLRIGVSTVSTGKKGYETPTGVFTILQKKKDHKSNLYDDAPMPFMQRLTWDGVALHAGRNGLRREQARMRELGAVLGFLRHHHGHVEGGDIEQAARELIR